LAQNRIAANSVPLRKNIARDTPMLSLVRRKICPSDTVESIMPRDTQPLSLVRRMSDASDTTQPRVSRYAQCVTLARRLPFARRRSETSDSTRSIMLLYMPIETLPRKKRRCALPIPTTIKTTTISPPNPHMMQKLRGAKAKSAARQRIQRAIDGLHWPRQRACSSASAFPQKQTRR